MIELTCRQRYWCLNVFADGVTDVWTYLQTALLMFELTCRRRYLWLNLLADDVTDVWTYLQTTLLMFELTCRRRCWCLNLLADNVTYDWTYLQTTLLMFELTCRLDIYSKIKTLSAIFVSPISLDKTFKDTQRKLYRCSTHFSYPIVSLLFPCPSMNRSWLTHCVFNFDWQHWVPMTLWWRPYLNRLNRSTVVCPFSFLFIKWLFHFL